MGFFHTPVKRSDVAALPDDVLQKKAQRMFLNSQITLYVFTGAVLFVFASLCGYVPIGMVLSGATAGTVLMGKMGILIGGALTGIACGVKHRLQRDNTAVVLDELHDRDLVLTAPIKVTSLKMKIEPTPAKKQKMLNEREAATLLAKKKAQADFEKAVENAIQRDTVVQVPVRVPQPLDFSRKKPKPFWGRS